MKTISKALNIIATAFTLIVLLTALVFITPRFFGYTPYIVESGSMEPMIHVGSVAYINTKDKEVAVNDIVTYKISGSSEDKLVTHRIIREENGEYITKGDANDVEDLSTVEKDQIVGTYAYSIPKAGFVLAKKDKLTPVLAVWVIGLNALAIFGNVLADREEKEEEEEIEEVQKEQESKDVPEAGEKSDELKTQEI